MKQSKVAEVARRVVAARKSGKASYSEGGTTFNLTEKGYCARFVRQCHEAAAGLPAFGFPFSAATAREMEQKLKAAAKGVQSPMPGDIVGMNNQSYAAGHIGIFLGDGLFAENTSSSSRGDPRAAGTKISPLLAVQHEISGYYRVYESDALKLVVQTAAGWEVVECNLRIEGGVARVDLRPVMEKLGYTVTDHIADQGKVYLSLKAP